MHYIKRLPSLRDILMLLQISKLEVFFADLDSALTTSNFKTGQYEKKIQSKGKKEYVAFRTRIRSIC